MTVTLERLRRDIAGLGKSAWAGVLAYAVALHERSTHPALPPLPYPWEETGPGYCYGPAFGHWDIVHAMLDVLPSEPDHALEQLRNLLATQQPDGFLPSILWMRERPPRPLLACGHPPVWPFAAIACAEAGAGDIPRECLIALTRQIAWFENHRRAETQGFYYLDILNNMWESGVDEGVRFLNVPLGPFACVDATAHVFALYEYADRWARAAGADPRDYGDRAETLREFIRRELFSEETGFFHDIWSVRDATRRRLSFEGMWPVVCGAATQAQAERLIFENLLNPNRFFSAHPLATVALNDPAFEPRMWRGPAWNSMTYWAARGCQRYGYPGAAAQLLERALDDTAVQFERTGTLWEFYHPNGGRPESLQRKPHTGFKKPCRDYVGHNPVIAMARLYAATSGKETISHDKA